MLPPTCARCDVLKSSTHATVALFDASLCSKTKANYRDFQSVMSHSFWVKEGLFLFLNGDTHMKNKCIKVMLRFVLKRRACVFVSFFYVYVGTHFLFENFSLFSVKELLFQ